MPPPQALAIARQKGLDLVEIAATANPPVCRIMDFGRYQYQEQKRARSAKKHQKVRRQRTDFHHKTALALLRAYDTL